jgi:hypothetical protein
VRELERYGVAVRDRSEIAQVHGEAGQLKEVTLTSGERLPFSYLFLFLGASPCTDWLDQAIARDDDGFILIGPKVGREDLLETSVPGVYAAGDVRVARPSDAQRPSARERWSCSSFTPTSRERAQRSDSELRHCSHPSDDFPSIPNPPSNGGNRQ